MRKERFRQGAKICGSGVREERFAIAPDAAL
jgi:hypothetical protein